MHKNMWMKCVQNVVWVSTKWLVAHILYPQADGTKPTLGVKLALFTRLTHHLTTTFKQPISSFLYLLTSSFSALSTPPITITTNKLFV